jgi:Divergent InlB B-repeat domain
MRRAVWRIAPLLGAVLALACGMAQRAVASEAPPIAPLYWSGPVPVDPGRSLTGMSCPSASLCVATDDAGNVVTSTDPAGGAETWTVTNIDGTQAIEGLSCASVSLCVAIDESGNALVSTNPTSGAAAWALTHIDAIFGLNAVTGVSCVAGPLCVVTDADGNVVTSTDPTGGAGAWTTADIDAGNSLNDVSCASLSLCVAVDDAGNVLDSSSPSAGAGAWARADVNGTSPILGVSCTTAPLCVAGGVQGAQAPRIVLTSVDPAGGAGAWTATSSAREGDGVAEIGQGVSCVAASLCVAVTSDDNDGLWESGDPAAGASAWDNDNPDITFLDSVSCATRSFCVVGDGKGDVVTSIETHALSVSLQGAGTGAVSATPIACPFTTCSHPVPPGMILAPPITAVACANLLGAPEGAGTCALGYPAGDEVTLTAEPIAGSVFSGWGGACTGRSASCTLRMTADESVLAGFAVAAPPTQLPAPAISGLGETARTWREGNALAHITAATDSRRRLPSGTTFSFALNVSARVTLTFARSAAGRKLANRCVAQSKRNARGRRCVRTITAGKLTFSAPAGASRVRFDGVLSKHDKLKPGSYTLVVSAAASGERSAPRRLRFTIATARPGRRHRRALA